MEARYPDFVYTPEILPEITGSFLSYSHFIKDGKIYFTNACVGDSSQSSFDFNVYEIGADYRYLNTVELSRSDPDRVEDVIYFSQCAGGWGAKTTYTNDLVYAYGHQYHFVMALVIIFAMMAFPLYWFNKWWRRT